MNRSTMSLQDIFDTVYKGLREQGFKKSMDGSGCAYRGADGSKCAAGFLIADWEYSSAMEGHNFLAFSYDLGFSLAQARFITELQFDHDDSRGPQNMRLRLEQRARNRNLSIPE